MTNRLFLKFPAKAENVQVARIAVATFAASGEFTLGDVEDIKVAVQEAVSNAVLHAYGNGTGEVEVEATLDGQGDLTVIVRDNGKGIDDLKRAREPGFSTLEEHMGLGFSFMEAFMDSLWVESSPGRGTTVRMLKKRCR